MQMKFDLSANPQSFDILAALEGFEDFGTPTLTYEENGLRYLVNEFWTSRQRQANRLHEVSYRACFKPQLPAFFIDRLTGPGGVVYDPFMGRGTTLLEGALRGRSVIGNDINPLSAALIAPRLSPPTLSEIQQRLAKIPWERFTGVANLELLTFFHEQTLAHIEGLRAWLLERQSLGVFDRVDNWIRMVALNRLTGHSSGFFSVYTLPPNQAVSVARQQKINRDRGQVPPIRDVAKIIWKKSRTLLSQDHGHAETFQINTGPANATPDIQSASVDLVVTSPPFLDVVDYQADNWMRCWFLGIEADAVAISKHKSVADWTAFTKETLNELERVVRHGGHVAYEVGEVRNGKVLLEQAVVEAAQSLRFDVLGVMVNAQEFTKTANCWGVSNNKSGTNTNRIVLMRRQ